MRNVRCWTVRLGGLVWISVCVGCTSNVVREHQADRMPTLFEIYRQHQTQAQRALTRLRASAPVVLDDDHRALAPEQALTSNPKVPLYVFEHPVTMTGGETLAIPAYETAFAFDVAAPSSCLGAVR